MTASVTEGHKRTFRTLDGLRGIAALAVVFRHIPENAVGRWTPESYLAVDLFFILSGFVLGYAYEERLRSGMSVPAFFAARLIRLYPLYIAASLITLLLVFIPAMPGHYRPPDRSLRTIVLAILFVPAIDPAHNIGLFPLVGPAWSLCFELAANFVFAVIATRLDTRMLSIIIFAGAGLLILTASAFGSIDVGYAIANAWGGFGRVGFAFFAGIAVWRVWRSDALPWLRLPGWAAAVLVVLIFAVEPVPHEAAWNVAVVLLVMPPLVLASARGYPGRWLAHPFVILGGASYGIYILQNPIDQWFETLVPWKYVESYAGTGTAGALVIAAIIVAIALLFDRYYDIPVRRALTRALRDRTVANAAGPVAVRRGVSGR